MYEVLADEGHGNSAEAGVETKAKGHRISAERKVRIRGDILELGRSVSVIAQIAKAHNVSVATVRREITTLEDEGKIERTPRRRRVARSRKILKETVQSKARTRRGSNRSLFSSTKKGVIKMLVALVGIFKKPVA